MPGKVVDLQGNMLDPQEATFEYRGQTITIEHRTKVNDYAYLVEVRRDVVVPLRGFENTQQKAIEAARADIDKIMDALSNE